MMGPYIAALYALWMRFKTLGIKFNHTTISYLSIKALNSASNHTMADSEVAGCSQAAESGASDIRHASGHPDHMPKQFTLWSLLAFAIAVCSAWIATSSLLSTHLVFGGFAAATWIPIASGVVAIIPALGLAELASAYPSSGGQYQ